MTRYRTKHREKLVHFFEKFSQENFSVAQIHGLLKDEDYSIGIATLYRQIAALASEGLLASIQVQGVDRYYYVGDGEGCFLHYHLKCLECGKLFHLDCSFMAELEKHMESHHGFKISRRDSTLYGRCLACGGKEE